MFVVFEISRPLQAMPGLYRTEKMIRIWWMCFALSIHRGRLDELVWDAEHGLASWKYS